MDAPETEWFRRHARPGEEWSGPGFVLTADYHAIYLLNDDIDHLPEASDSIAWASPEGNVIFSTVRRYGPVIVQVEQLTSAPDAEDINGWDATTSFVLPVVDDAFLLHSPFGEPSFNIQVPAGDHRVLVRRVVSGKDAVNGDDDYFNVSEPPYEFLLVQLWPTGGNTESDRLRRFRASRDLTAWAAAARRSEDAAEHAGAARRAELWGRLDPPSDLEAIGPEAAHAAKGSYELALGLTRSSPRAARETAAWAVEAVAAEIDGPPPVDLTSAVEAIRSGAPLPAPFDDIDMAFRAMLPPIGEGGFGSFSFGAQPTRPRGATAATSATCAAICSTNVANPIEAAMRALNQAAAGHVDKAEFWRRAEEAFRRLQ